MKTTNANIIQRVTLLLAACASTWAAAVFAGSGAETSVKVGPGRVTFDLSRTGRWVALVPEWTEGQSVFSGGGFVVLAVDEDGSVQELANTAADGERLRGAEQTLMPAYEGIPGGRRFPLPQRDDDGDGNENEDRLDGVDNDGDGSVDEDYAAAGDQMVALAFDALDESGEPLLRFHQENCAWTLPHIDGMVAIKLSVRNVSQRSLDEVRIGALVRLDGSGEISVSTQDLGPTSNKPADHKLASKGILLTRTGEQAVAVLFFAEPATENDAWLTGLAKEGHSLTGRVQAFVDAERRIDTPVETGPEPDNLDQVERPESNEGPGRTAYGVSPSLGVLNPGDEVVVYAAVVAVPEMTEVDAAIEAAYRTVIGDGNHRMVPPTVSLKRRTVWGNYKVWYADEGESPSGTTITLENARAQGIGPNDITYLSGIDIRRVEAEELFNGDLELTMGGELYGEIADTGNRVELHGRLKNGDIFDLVLNPVDGDTQREQVDGVSESQFWSQPGRLEPELLSGSPNPFRESTTIFYEVPNSVSDEDGSVLDFVNPVATSVKIYSVTGRLVSILVDTILSPGQYNTSWEASDDSGNNVASGVYYIKLQIGKKHVTKRLIQLK